MPSQTTTAIDLPLEEIADFCRRYHIRELALFGSVLRSDFGPDSDIDVLIEFEPGTKVGFFKFFEVQDELEATLGRNVDLVTKAGLKRLIRDEILNRAQVIYAA